MYHITSNSSNYSDSVMNYFLPPIQLYTSITLNISCSNYTDSSLTHDHSIYNIHVVRTVFIYTHGSMINEVHTRRSVWQSASFVIIVLSHSYFLISSFIRCTSLKGPSSTLNVHGIWRILYSDDILISRTLNLLII